MSMMCSQLTNRFNTRNVETLPPEEESALPKTECVIRVDEGSRWANDGRGTVVMARGRGGLAAAAVARYDGLKRLSNFIIKLYLHNYRPDKMACG